MILTFLGILLLQLSLLGYSVLLLGVYRSILAAAVGGSFLCCFLSSKLILGFVPDRQCAKSAMSQNSKFQKFLHKVAGRYSSILDSLQHRQSFHSRTLCVVITATISRCWTQVSSKCQKLKTEKSHQNSTGVVLCEWQWT